MLNEALKCPAQVIDQCNKNILSAKTLGGALHEPSLKEFVSDLCEGLLANEAEKRLSVQTAANPPNTCETI